ncbi:phage/plasmid replication protein, II/X family [Acinetobacter baumannii]|uniref:phage/plasmid replication protein, II/X family n=2 Tax=Acinetobacter baumannii TaxID=470 RepID=UPI00070DFB17|nr:phage/plasmid replication protein, II/X family [Acinetobacter baumannii]KRJ23236.1 DNA replication protein [Acinetobacter baumannii]MDC4329354.1 phage/plasmid replication protein, II/X family [Acinetobacter baumannii]MDC4392587.1 phage/plasmid replication protein, II/X family [Acinetobacter baumannii]MDC5181035.1 phage/plasmid replication protein, II/X family [Acinetobacter baumannii]MDC5221665.1 phage/plasmid replication protein, II/X family [Acinetobacter baumannii]
MLDHICINAPFESSFYSVDAEGRYFFVDIDLHTIEIPLASRSVHKNDDGSISAAALFHPYESVPTHYTGMAMKVFFDASYEPYVQIKASPAKLLQGHNVFGSDDIEQGADEMIGFLHMAYPVLTKMLDWTRAWVSHIDVTYSAKLSDQTTAKKVLDFLANVSNGQTRLSNKRFDSSVYWGGQTSRLVNHKCYLKHDEFLSQFEELKQLAKKNDKSAQRVVDVMSDSRLINWTVGLLRFESRLKKRWLERNGVPTNLYELIAFQKANPDLLQTLWTKATHSIFDAMRGQTVKLINDESVLEAISNSPVVVTNSGKVSQTRIRNIYATYCLIREHGLEKLAEMLPKPTFYRHLSELCECGFSKAFLQNLHDNKAKNVIPFMKLVEIDFSQQLPEWYEPPVSQFKSVA